MPTKLLEPRLNISIKDDTVELAVLEEYTKILNVVVDHKQFMCAMGRLMGVPCESATLYPNHAGKREEHQEFEFPLPSKVSLDKRKEVARKVALKKCPKGWTPDLEFNSQGSFFEKDGKKWARTTIRRWV